VNLTNNPPPDASHFLTLASDYAAQVDKWSEVEITAANAPALRDVIAAGQDLMKMAEKARVALKEPYLEHGRRIDSEFKPVAVSCSESIALAKSRLAAFVASEERRRHEEAEKARIAAEEARRSAAALSGDALLSEDAVEEARKAKVAAELAEAMTRVTVKGGTGRAMGLRTKRSARIVDQQAAMLFYASHLEMLALVLKLANADIRGGRTAIPGVEIVEDRVL